MRPGGDRVTVRRALGLASVLFLVAAGPGGTATAVAATGSTPGRAVASSPRPGEARASRSARVPSTVALSLTDMGKGWVTSGGKLTLKGQIANRSGQPLPG